MHSDQRCLPWEKLKNKHLSNSNHCFLLKYSSFILIPPHICTLQDSVPPTIMYKGWNFPFWRTMWLFEGCFSWFPLCKSSTFNGLKQELVFQKSKLSIISHFWRRQHIWSELSVDESLPVVLLFNGTVAWDSENIQSKLYMLLVSRQCFRYFGPMIIYHHFYRWKKLHLWLLLVALDSYGAPYDRGGGGVGH